MAKFYEIALFRVSWFSLFTLYFLYCIFMVYYMGRVLLALMDGTSSLFFLFLMFLLFINYTVGAVSMVMHHRPLAVMALVGVTMQIIYDVYAFFTKQLIINPNHDLYSLGVLAIIFLLSMIYLKFKVVVITHN